MTTLILLGPPGAGKGTQAGRIADRYGVPAISTGEIFRSNISKGTELGKLAQSFTDRGELVPDSVTNPMVRERLEQDDAEGGFLLDGYPRNLDQAHVLADMLGEMDVDLDAVLEITADEEVLVQRMLKRAEEQHRADDTEDVIRHRFEVYREQTAPMSAYYREQGQLVSVDGIGTIEEVSERILAALDEFISARKG